MSAHHIVSRWPLGFNAGKYSSYISEFKSFGNSNLTAFLMNMLYTQKIIWINIYSRYISRQTV